MKLYRSMAGTAMAAVLIGVPVGGVAVSHRVQQPLTAAAISGVRAGAGESARQAQPPQPTPTLAATDGNADGENNDGNTTQDPALQGSIPVPQDPNGQGEADESAALQKLAKISPDDAKTAALAANPGTTAAKVTLENENGFLVYSVVLSNGMDVKVDAGNSKILSTDKGGAETGAQDSGTETGDTATETGDAGTETGDAPGAAQP